LAQPAHEVAEAALHLVPFLFAHIRIVDMREIALAEVVFGHGRSETSVRGAGQRAEGLAVAP
jgi:hypothetical protein